MDKIEIGSCARDLVAVAGCIRNAAHGRGDALALHDIARLIEAAADQLTAIEDEACRLRAATGLLGSGQSQDCD